MTTDHIRSQRRIAEAFSKGDFELAYPFFAETIEWHVVGENSFVGKQAVIDNCEQTAKYFKTVSTDFITLNVIEDHNRVAINGTAAFARNDERLAYVSACDVYEFNDDNELEKINSYCITQK